MQFALNLHSTANEWEACPLQVMTGRVPRMAVSVVAGNGPDGWCVSEEVFLPEVIPDLNPNG